MIGGNYGAHIQKADFRTPATAQLMINEWIARETNGGIRNYLQDLSDKTHFLMLNTLSFQSAWGGDYFDERITAPGDFYGVSSAGPGAEPSVSKVEMMRSDVVETKYLKDSDFEYVTLDFGNGAYEIRFVVPCEGLDFDRAMDLLTKERYDGLVAQAHSDMVMVTVPKFEIDGRVDLVDVLASKGVDIGLFTDNNMFNETLDNALLLCHQGVRFAMDEKGAKVVSATVSSDAELLPVVKEVNINRPFMFFVTERSTNACLVAGRVLGF